MRTLDQFFKALGNRRRLAIVRLLKKAREVSVTDIAQHIKLSHRSTSKHLAILFAAEIVEKDQRSLQVFYKLDNSNPNLKHFLSIV